MANVHLPLTVNLELGFLVQVKFEPDHPFPVLFFVAVEFQPLIKHVLGQLSLSLRWRWSLLWGEGGWNDRVFVKFDYRGGKVEQRSCFLRKLGRDYFERGQILWSYHLLFGGLQSRFKVLNLIFTAKGLLHHLDGHLGQGSNRCFSWLSESGCWDWVSQLSELLRYVNSGHLSFEL